MANFFIDRPIFAWVIAIVIMLAGVLSIMKLPVSQYPSIAPPSVQISAVYPGASAKTVEATVTQVIEQQMNGIDNLLYISSTSDSSGSASILLTFMAGTNPDIAQVQVQNKLQLAMPLLPQVVQQQGVKVAKSTRNFMVVVGFVSNDGSMSKTDLADYVAAYIQDPVSRVHGVGETVLFGAQYSMRVWLDPDKLNSYGLNAADVNSAIQAQNAEVSSGQLGGMPIIAGQRINATITSQNRLQRVDQFREILLRVNPDGSQVRLRDVARIELGSENYDIDSRFMGKPATGLAIRLGTGANALDTAEGVRAKIKELSAYFPAGMNVVYPYDTTPFIEISIEEVVKTLGEAILLVFCVMYLFLQNFRATLIPTIAVPVVLLGTFGVLAAFGFSINTLTMFGMVLAIGLLVDDAIVVVENVERVMSEEGLSPKEATRKSMGQIIGALVGIALVLSAVFLPMAFFGGSVGAIYRQFSITIASSMILSVLIAVILTPALCATLLKPVEKGHGAFDERPGFFGWFNRNFNRSTRLYRHSVRGMLRYRPVAFIFYAVIFAAMIGLFLALPTSFLPDEDQGIGMIQAQLPAGSTLEQTSKVAREIEQYFMEEEKDSVESVFTVIGYSFSGRGQNAMMGFIRLKDWSLRKSPDQKIKAVIGRAMKHFSTMKEANVFIMAPPAIIELGTANGFDFQLQDRAGLGHEVLMQARNQLLMEASQKKDLLMAVRPNGMDDTPQYRIVVDQEKASALGLSIADINNNLSSAWGSAYVNDFIDKGRVKKVYVQADAPYRMLPEDVDRWYVRNAKGGMVPFSAFSTGYWSFGSPRLERYNGMPSLQIQGNAAPGKSTGDAMAAMQDIAQKLPLGIGYEWTGISYEERLSGSEAPALYALSLLVVFLCLAALYESWSVPFSVMLVVPLGVVGSLSAVWLMGMSDDVYFKVGLLVIIGLSAKNAILIVEFAKELQESGMELIEATLEAARMRLRPILMTSLAFVVGVLPLALSNGAGSGAQNAIGVGVVGGMITATFLAVFFVPLFFVSIRQLFRAKKTGSGPALSEAPVSQEH
ncbi:MAG: efflux RND transporter permease subunit [Betaproteobacteria bacterium]|nr:efflux RND transporter permease subunit [Betaproteobacteria bacterium]